MNRLLITLTAALLTAPAWAAPGDDEAALKLATGAGCMTCHHIEPGAKGPNGLPPIGPAWRDVAAKYSSVKGAQQPGKTRSAAWPCRPTRWPSAKWTPPNWWPGS